MRILENMKFQNATGAAIFWRKIRIFLPCRVGHRILCLSTFGQSQGVSGKSADNERTFWCHEGAHTKVLKLSVDYEHTLWNVPNLEKHRSSGMFDVAWLEIPDFAIKIAAPCCIWNAIVSFSCHKTYPVKMQSVTAPFSGNKKRKRKRFLLRVGLLLLTVAVPRGIEPLFSP